MGEDDPGRAFVLGLDGVPWGELNDWIDAGHLPNFARLREEGVSGPCTSTEPPTTALAWPSIATGVWPDKHGVYGFQRLEADYTHRMSTSRDVTAPALWDLLGPAVVGNVPMTYPAEPIDGEMVAGMMTPEIDDRFTHPPALREEITERIPDYRIGLTWSEYGDRPGEFVTDLETLATSRRELMRVLMNREDWRLFFFVYTAPDRLQHLRWEESVLLDHYRFLDEMLGEVMDYVAAHDASLFVVSDHGFGPVDRRVAVNRVLEEHGYLVREESGGLRSLLANLGLSKDDVLAALDSFGIDQETLVNRLPRGLVDTVAGQVPGSHALYDVDFSRTTAFVHGTGCLYVNDTERFEQGIVDPADRDAVAAEVAEILSDVTDPDTGEPILRVGDGTEIFATDDDSPDLTVRTAPSYVTVTALEDEIVAPLSTMEGAHDPEGILFAWGSGIDQAGTLGTASVVDLAPTLLHSVGEAVPENADGRVLAEILSDDATVVERPVDDADRRAAGEDGADFADVEERLRGLGYMD